MTIEEDSEEAESQEYLAVERSKDISELLTNISELGEVFKDLNILVVEQGTILDRIDYNIEQAQVHTEKAVTELLKAEKHQKSMRSTWCILALIILIVVFCIALIFKSDIWMAAI